MVCRRLMLAVVLVFAYGCSDGNNNPQDDLVQLNTVPIAPPSFSQPEWLYVQTAATAQMTSDTTLEIPVTRDIFAFTDRPHREHDHLTAFEFASFWSEAGANSFSEDPPNAVLTWRDGEEQREAEVIIHDAIVYSDGEQESLVYEVTLETENMPDAQMSSVSFFVDSNTDCSSANWKPKAYLVGCDLHDKDLTGYDLSGANLTGATLTLAKLNKANLSGATLSRANLSLASLENANLEAAMMVGGSLFSAYLVNANLERVVVANATLTLANMKGANLRHSILGDSTLAQANLTDADLSYADLEGSYLNYANLTNADLTEAGFLGASFIGAICKNTTMPGGGVTSGPESDCTEWGFPERF